MSIIAISQTLGSLGDEIGRELARALGWDFADREILLKTADRFGEGLPALQHATDERPTLWERFTGATEPYRTYVEAIIWEMAARDDAVLVGRGAAFVSPRCATSSASDHSAREPRRGAWRPSMA